MLSSLLVSAALALGQTPAIGSASSDSSAPVWPAPAAQVRFGRPVPVEPVPPAADGFPIKTAAFAQDPGGGAERGTFGPAKGAGNRAEDKDYRPGFFRNFFKDYCDEFFPKKNGNAEEAEPEPAPRRGLPEPWSAPPFPGHEYQGYPLIGVPAAPLNNPLMNGLFATPYGEFFKDNRIRIYGWVTVSGNWSTAKNSNSPTSYWLAPNRMELDQAVLRLEREVDTVQTDHMDWGFRSTGIYGIDYRYTTAGGWLSRQLLVHNRLNGFDPLEQYFDWYVPWVAQGMVIRVGRWVATPDIETQLAPDNYLGSHSLLFTYDTYTQTGVMGTFKLSDQWMVQAAIQSGTDMAPWYVGATPTGFFGVRWVSKDNNDAFYTCLNNINNAQFRHFTQDGQPAGHDNYNYLVSTWEHRFTKEIHTKTEAYFMWQKDAELGGTPSLGPVQFFGGGGGDSTLLPGWSYAYGVLNYTMFAITKSDYITARNELWRDERGMRSGVPGTYTSHTIGLSHNVNSLFQIRPEIGYYRNWNNQAFDLGSSKGIWMYGFDMTMRF